MSNCTNDLGPDCDIYLDCGCVVAINHGDWSWDLTQVDECTEMHDRDEAIAIAQVGQ